MRKKNVVAVVDDDEDICCQIETALCSLGTGNSHAGPASARLTLCNKVTLQTNQAGGPRSTVYTLNSSKSARRCPEDVKVKTRR